MMSGVDSMKKYYAQGAIGWFVASFLMSLLWFSTHGPVALWIMAIAAPYYIAYTIGFFKSNRED